MNIIHRLGIASSPSLPFHSTSSSPLLQSSPSAPLAPFTFYIDLGRFIDVAMEALRTSKAVCPFLKKTSPSQLRLLSSASAPTGIASRLQNYGQKCPVMGPALATQSTRMSHATLMKTALGTARAYHTGSKTSKANLHTGNVNKAQAVDVNMLRQENGMRCLPHVCTPLLTHYSAIPFCPASRSATNRALRPPGWPSAHAKGPQIQL